MISIVIFDLVYTRKPKLLAHGKMSQNLKSIREKSVDFVDTDGTFVSCGVLRDFQARTRDNLIENT